MRRGKPCEHKHKATRCFESSMAEGFRWKQTGRKGKTRAEANHLAIIDPKGASCCWTLPCAPSGPK